MAFQIGGMASGLDTQSIIEQLMVLERRPVTMLQKRKDDLSKSNSAFQSLNTRLASLQSKLTDLLLEKNLKAKATTSSDTNILTATAGSGAAAGTYKVKVNQLATATSVASSGAAASPATGALTLANVKPSNTTAITTGTFTIGGATVTINSTNASLQEVVDAINGSASANVSVSGSAGLGAGGATLDAATGQIKLDVTGVTPAVGSGGDTSNFLTIAGLQSPSRTTVGANTYLVGARMNVTQTTAKINDAGANGANLTTAVTPGSGEFKINGVSITFNTGTDSLNDVLGRINSSTAGVVASYNSIEDKLVLTNKTTGASAISLQDVTGNFLAATKLSGASQTTGLNAQIVVDGVNGNNPLESSTNEFKDIIPSVNFTAKKVETANWTTVSVSRDTDTTLNTVKGFLNEFNATVDALEGARAKGQPLATDSAVFDILSKIRRLVQDPVSGLSDSPNTLSAIGIGTTNTDRKHLSLDETKFKGWLDKNPDRLVEIFNKDATAANPAGVAARLKDYLSDLRSSEGVFTSRNNAFTRQSKQIDEQIRAYEGRLENRRQLLVSQFTAMEKAVGLMKSQQSAMLSQLGSLQSR